MTSSDIVSLKWRLLISAILIPSLIALFAIDSMLGHTAGVLLVMCVVLSLVGASEMSALLRTRSFHPSFPLVAVCTITVVCSGWWHQLIDDIDSFPDYRTGGLGPITLTFVGSILVLFFSGAMRYREPGQSVETLGAEILIVAYVGVLLAVTAQLRWVAGEKAGYLAVGSLVIAAKAGDVGAYTLGRLWGRRKMVPLLSPGKTWMGAVGAVLGAGLGSVAWLHWGTPLFDRAWVPCEWYWSLLFGVIIGVVGLVGDLSESLIKRDVGQKDSATLLPAFGGVLDVLDSILYAGPVAFFSLVNFAACNVAVVLRPSNNAK